MAGAGQPWWEVISFFVLIFSFYKFCPGTCPWLGPWVILEQLSANRKKIKMFQSHPPLHILRWWFWSLPVSTICIYQILFKVGHLTSMAAATRSWALAYLCIFHLPQQFGQVWSFYSPPQTNLCFWFNLLLKIKYDIFLPPPLNTSVTQVYPAFGPGKDFTLDWMLLIVARNLVATWIICGFWDWFLYFSPLQVRILLIYKISKLFQAKLAKYKMNPQYPSFNQIKHDALVRNQQYMFHDMILIEHTPSHEDMTHDMHNHWAHCRWRPQQVVVELPLRFSSAIFGPSINSQLSRSLYLSFLCFVFICHIWSVNNLLAFRSRWIYGDQSALCFQIIVLFVIKWRWSGKFKKYFQPLSEAPVMNLMFALLVTHYR